MNQQAYKAAREAAVYVDQSTAGCVVLKGNNRLDVVHRLSTNAVRQLQPGNGQRTVFTNHNGRIIDLVEVLECADQTLIVTNNERGPEIAAYLQRNKFFNDTFTVKDESASASQLQVYGPQATALLQQFTSHELADLPLWAHQTFTIDECTIRVQRIMPIHGAGWRILTDVAGIEAVGEALDEQGATFLDQQTYAVLRIEHGYPDIAELNPEYIPLESNLWDAVSFTKGCYVGQEIIARMESRGRLAKKLAGVRLESAVAPPIALDSNGKDAGTVTSVAFSPLLEQWIGLAYVRAAYWEPGTELQVGDQTIQVTALPFIGEEILSK